MDWYIFIARFVVYFFMCVFKNAPIGGCWELWVLTIPNPVSKEPSDTQSFSLIEVNVLFKLHNSFFNCFFQEHYWVGSQKGEECMYFCKTDEWLNFSSLVTYNYSCPKYIYKYIDWNICWNANFPVCQPPTFLRLRLTNQQIWGG